MKQRLAASPLAQKAMSDPAFMQSVLAANPAMSALFEGNPRLKAMITSPDALQGMISGVRHNPLHSRTHEGSCKILCL